MSVLRASWIAMNLSPVYVMASLLLGDQVVPGWILVAGLFIIFLPAGYYLIRYACPACGETLYSLENIRGAPGGLRRLTLYWLPRCPHCRRDIPA